MHVAWPSCAWLQLIFFPFPVGNPMSAGCRSRKICIFGATYPPCLETFDAEDGVRDGVVREAVVRQVEVREQGEVPEAPRQGTGDDVEGRVQPLQSETNNFTSPRVGEILQLGHCLQGGWGGWPTGNREKLSSCQAQLGQATCLAVA